MSLVGCFPAAFLIQRWLTAGIVEQQVFVDVLEGFPQGGPISPLLCNIAMTGIVEIAQQVENPKPVTVRYADDFVILTRTREGALKARQAVGEFLKSRGLEF
jgi:RNA-directed DNA polymerase